jgi:hypothetical protein
LVELVGWVARRALPLSAAEQKELEEIVSRTDRAERKETTERAERRVVGSYLLADLHRHLMSLPVLGVSDG